MKSLASDNYAGAIPEAIEALLAANQDHAPAYGNDPITQELKETFISLLTKPFQLHLVFNGTGANLFGLSTMAKPYSAILCAETAHIYVDESTAPETLTGCRLFPLPIDKHGKLTPSVIRQAVKRRGDLHHPQINILSITQPTEYGTLYTLEELREIRNVANNMGLRIYLDGSRIFTALTALRCSLNDLIEACGVDVISIGGTKSGMLFGEAVLVFNPAIQDSAFFHKRSTQLASKNRFIAAQFLGLLQGDTYRKYSTLMMERAKQLEQVLRKYPAINITKPVEANVVFAILPREWIKPLQDILFFYIWDESTNEVRLMCSFDTSEHEITLFDKKLAELSQGSVPTNS